MDWLRLWIEWGHDPKVQTMPEHMQRRHIMLLCLRRQTDTAKLSDAEIAWYMNIPLHDALETKELFELKGFTDNGWSVLSWEDRQPQSDSSKERTRKWRERQKKKQKTVSETSLDRHGDAVEQNREEKKVTLVHAPKYMDLIWSSYPRKDHSLQAKEKIAARINAGANPFELSAASQNYAELVKKEKRERKHMMMGKTFFGSNEPWLDYKDRVVKCVACGKECLEHERNEADACKDCC